MKLLILFFALFTLLFGALNPKVYQDLKEKAYVIAIIKVIKVDKSIKANQEYIVAKAEVLRLIKPNSLPNTIIIKYTKPHKLPPFIIGPKVILTLKENRVYKAYLNKKGNIFVPAALGESFIEIK